MSIVVGSLQDEGGQQLTCPTAEARFRFPQVAVDGDGNCVISDQFAHTVYLFRPAQGTVSVLAGSGDSGSADGVGAAASFDRPGPPVINRKGSVSNSLRLYPDESGFITQYLICTGYTAHTFFKQLALFENFIFQRDFNASAKTRSSEISLSLSLSLSLSCS